MRSRNNFGPINDHSKLASVVYCATIFGHFKVF